MNTALKTTVKYSNTHKLEKIQYLNGIKPGTDETSGVGKSDLIEYQPI